MNSFYQTEIRGTFAVGNEKNEEMGLIRPMGLMRGNRAKKHGHGGGNSSALKGAERDEENPCGKTTGHETKRMYIK